MRYRTQFWVSTDGSHNTKADFDNLLRRHANSADRIKQLMRQVAVAAARGKLRGGTATKTLRPLLEILEMLLRANYPWVPARSTETLLTVLNTMQQALPPEVTAATRRNYPKKDALQTAVDLVLRRPQKRWYQLQLAIERDGSSRLLVDVGLDVEVDNNVAVVTFWKVDEHGP